MKKILIYLAISLFAFNFVYANSIMIQEDIGRFEYISEINDDGLNKNKHIALYNSNGTNAIAVYHEKNDFDYEGYLEDTEDDRIQKEIMAYNIDFIPKIHHYFWQFGEGTVQIGAIESENYDAIEYIPSIVEKYIQKFPPNKVQIDEPHNLLIRKGWNLVHFYPNPVDSIKDSSEIQIDSIFAVFIYVNTRQKMYEAYPTSTIEKDGYITENDIPYIFNSAYWIYAEQEGILEVDRETSTLSIDETKLINGWNFLGVTKEMINEKLINLIGNCQIEESKVYHWHALNQNWQKININENIGKDLLEQGLVIKVKDNCDLQS